MSVNFSNRALGETNLLEAVVIASTIQPDISTIKRFSNIRKL